MVYFCVSCVISFYLAVLYVLIENWALISLLLRNPKYPPEGPTNNCCCITRLVPMFTNGHFGYAGLCSMHEKGNQWFKVDEKLKVIGYPGSNRPTITLIRNGVVKAFVSIKDLEYNYLETLLTKAYKRILLVNFIFWGLYLCFRYIILIQEIPRCFLMRIW